jgi:tRNA G37 N-methylase TrmD
MTRVVEVVVVVVVSWVGEYVVNAGTNAIVGMTMVAVIMRIVDDIIPANHTQNHEREWTGDFIGLGLWKEIDTRGSGVESM